MSNQTNKNQKLVIITGPTGIGKSDLAIRLASHLNGEIIGADSMQIYKGLNIGTGKTPLSQRQGIPHHMIDIVDPNEIYSVGAFVADAKKCISQISARKKQPFLVGGTGLYISSLLQAHTFSSAPRNEALREQLNAMDSQFLHKKLSEVDPISAQKINPNDKKRIVRALEIFHVTKIPKSQQADPAAQPYCDYLLIVLTQQRERLYQKINSRVDKMLDSGLVDEVKSLLEKFGSQAQAMQAIGYKELIGLLENRSTLADAVSQLKTNTRRYAKRQITFFKNMPLNKHFFDTDEQGIFETLAQKINDFTRGKNTNGQS